MNSTVSKDIQKDICRKKDVLKSQCSEIIRSQFDTLKKSMEEYSLDDENYPTIRLPKWGLFFIKPSKKKDYGK